MFFVLKMVILVVIFMICTSIGILKAKMYQKRVFELKMMYNSLEVVKSKIQFTYEPIKDIFTEVSDIIYKNEPNIFLGTINLMKEKSLLDAWNQAVENEVKINNEDKSIIKMFGNLLGKTDKSGQINEINVTNKLLETQIEKAENENKKNYKLYKTLGSVVGIGICILLF